MRILNITAQKPDSTGSGIYLKELVNALSSDNNEQGVVAGISPGDAPVFNDGVSFYPVYYNTPQLPFDVAGMSDEMPYPSTRYRDFTETMYCQYAAAFRQQITKAVTELEPEVIICHHLYLLAALVRSWFPTHKLIGICHGSDLRQFQKNRKWHDFISARIREMNTVCVLHETMAEEVSFLFSMPPEKITVTGTGYNDAVFFNQHLPRKSSCRTLTYAGKLSEKKGVMSLLRSLSYLPYEPSAFRLCLAGGAGNDDEMKQIQTLASASRYRVELRGLLSQPELATLYNESDCFVIPSFYDGLPLVLFESLACGIPAICTDLPGIKSWFDSHVPNHGVIFVRPPRMCNTDEPLAEDLPAFEENLAAAVRTAIETPGEAAPDLRSVSWRRISESIRML